MTGELHFVLRWLAAIYLLGGAVYPLTAWIFSRTRDRGYIESRLFGIILLPYLSWLLAHLRWVPFSRGGLFFVIFVVGGICWSPVLLAVKKRGRSALVMPPAVALWAEGAFLSVFLIFLAARAYNPDIYWSESSMDMSFLTTCIRTRYFPPPDVWFAGATVNYYHYGHMVMAYLAKAAHVPANYAYNLAMATVPASVALVIFGVLYRALQSVRAGILGVLIAQFMGNLDAFLFVVARWVRIAAEKPNELERLSGLERALLSRLSPETLESLMEISFFRSAKMIFSVMRSAHDIIPSTVHEFPAWTSLFMDLHAHFLVMPFAVFLLLLESFLLERGSSELRSWSMAKRIAGLFLVALSLSVLIPTNSWDWPTHGIILVAFFTVAGWWRGPGWCVAWKMDLGLLRLTVRRLKGWGTWCVLPALLIMGLSLVMAIPHFVNFYRKGMGLCFLPASLPRTAVGPFLTFHLFFFFTLGMSGLMILYSHLVQRGAGARKAILFSLLFLLGLGLSIPSSRAIFEGALRIPTRIATSLSERGDESKLAGILHEMRADQELVPMRTPPGIKRGGMHRFSHLLRRTDFTSLSLVTPFFLLSLALLVLRRAHPAERTFNLFAMAGLGIIAGCELIYVKDFLQGGNLKRFNTLFKFYLQAWWLLSMASAGQVTVSWRAVRRALPKGKFLVWLPYGAWAFLLLAGLFYFPMGLEARRHRDTHHLRHQLPPTLNGWAYLDRTSPEIPRTQLICSLAGCPWKNEAKQKRPKPDRLFDPDEGAAYRWLWENVDGWPPPVILEATERDYKYEFGRVSANTGLPTLLGWWSHVDQRDYVTDRNRLYEEDIKTPRNRVHTASAKRATRDIYNQLDIPRVVGLMKTHRVKYVYVGRSERKLYDELGLTKFDDVSEVWERVFHQGGVSIYRVEESVSPEEMTSASAKADKLRGLQKPKSMFKGGQGRLKGEFNEPRGLAADRRGVIYVADFRNHRVQSFREDGTFVATIGGTKGGAPGEFHDLCDLAVLDDLHLAVADTINSRIQLFRPDGSFLRQWRAPAHPRGITVGPGPSLLVSSATDCQVVRYDLKGKELGRWGLDRGNGPEQFNRPQGLVCDESIVYVADTNNLRIQKLSLDGGFLGSFAVNLWNGPGLKEPYLCLTPAGDLLCTDSTKGMVAKLDKVKGTILQTWKTPGVPTPMGIVATPSGKVYIADRGGHRIVRLAIAERK